MDLFTTPNLHFRRKILVLAGAKIDITNSQTKEPLGFIKMKAFKLRESIKIYADSSQTQLLLAIKARQIIDFGATYDVFDQTEQTHLFSLQRKGLRSTFVRDKWNILDTAGNPYAVAEETGSIALVRRYIAIIPIFGDIMDIVLFWRKQQYLVYLLNGDQKGQVAGEMYRQKNPFVIKFTTDTTKAEAPISPSIMVALGTMLSVIEGAKN